MKKNKTSIIQKIKSRFSSERGEIGDSFIMVMGFGLAALLMFIFPLMTMSDRTDDVSQLAVETATTEFVDKVRSTGKITQDNYSDFVQTIGSTGNTYNVEMSVQVRDVNLGKKVTQAQADKIGENVSYTVFTSKIEEDLREKRSILL